MKYNLEELVSHKLTTVAFLLKRQNHRLISKKKVAITPDQWTILYYLWDKNGLSIGELANKSKKDCANVTRIIDKLIKYQYIEKRKDSSDARCCRIYLSEKAHNIQNKIESCWQESLDISMQNITPSEQNTLFSILCKMEENIGIHLKNNTLK